MPDDPYQYWRDLVRAVPTSVVQDIVADNRNRPSSGGSVLPTVKVLGAGTVVTGTDGAAHTPAQNHGWTEPPRTENWRAPGIDIIDRLVDQQDERDLEARCREQAATMGLSYGDWLRLMEKDLRDRRERKEKAAKDRKETPK
jgi:hypothetical protein